MKIRNIVKSVCLILFFAFCFSGCISPLMYNRHPSDQPGTTWRTKDNTIVFSIKEDDPHGYGYIETTEGTVDIVISMGMLTSCIEVCYATDFEKLEENDVFPAFAYWTSESVSRNKFVVRVDETVYLEPGQILTFYKD